MARLVPLSGALRVPDRALNRRAFLALSSGASAALLSGCGSSSSRPFVPPPPSTTLTPLLANLQQQTFNYFWETSDPALGLAPDRYPNPPFASIAAIGFALTAYPIGVENGWITRSAAAQRVQATLQFLWGAPQGTASSGCAGYQGFFYHFLDMQTGTRFETSELSVIDTTLLMAGVLFCGEYFNQSTTVETSIRQLAANLYGQVNWPWAQARAPAICLSWTPESGFSPYDCIGYNEGMIVYLLALGSPTSPVATSAWSAWTSGYAQCWGTVQGYEFLTFGPLFGHQYTQVWVNMSGIQDAFMSANNSDYFKNSRLAVLAQNAYAIANPLSWQGYGANLWGLTACDGPGDFQMVYQGQTRQIEGYIARGVGLSNDNDDGTVAPCAAIASLPFAPELVVPASEALAQLNGGFAMGQYGFLDAFNLSIPAGSPLTQGQYVAGSGWVDTQYLGIDQGPIVAMLENYRSRLIWSTMQQNASLVQGLQRAGFSGGWLG
jgi:hypothetical protein